MKNNKRSKKTNFLAFILSTVFTLNTYAEQNVFISPVIGVTSSDVQAPIIPWEYYFEAVHPMLSSSMYSPITPTTAQSYTQIQSIATTTPNRSVAIANANDVELLPWSYVRTFLTPHMHIQIYDVLTGLTYYVYSFSNGNHADVRTVSAADTAIMFHTFGYRWGWDVRPVWVTVGDRVIAASINGQPHGGIGNPANGLGGHVCLHFFGSNVHNGNAAFARLHQDVLHQAYSLAG